MPLGLWKKMIVITLPECGFDPTESTIPWHYLTQHGIKVYFATPNQKPSIADERMTSIGLSWLSPMLMTRKNVLKLYNQMINTNEFKHPLSYDAIDCEKLTGMVFPGGHGEGIKSMLESPILQEKIVSCFKLNKLIAAFCTGVLAVARSVDPETGKSVLYHKKTTAVTKFMEMSGWYLTRSFWGNYFKIYDTSAQLEIENLLASPAQFLTGGARLLPSQYSKHFIQGQFTVRDGNYLSGRWPGDAHKFSLELVQLAKSFSNRTYNE